jgi:hypothetical protein
MDNKFNKFVICNSHFLTCLPALFCENQPNPYSRIPGFNQMTVSALNDSTTLQLLMQFQTNVPVTKIHTPAVVCHITSRPKDLSRRLSGTDIFKHAVILFTIISKQGTGFRHTWKYRYCLIPTVHRHVAREVPTW